MVGEAVGSMSLEGFNILIRLALALLWFNSPCDCDSPLVFGVCHCSRDPKTLIQTSMDAMALLTWVKVRCGESCGYKVVLIEIGFNSSIDDRVDASISIRA